MRRLLLALLLVASCEEATEVGPVSVAPPPLLDAAPEDAGEEAFVQRVLPLVWGRRARGAAEVRVLAELARSGGREQLVRAMARSPEYLLQQEQFLKDTLGVARLGFSSNPVCYGTALRSKPTADLAAAVRDLGPFDTSTEAPFTLLDLLRSSLVLDDLSPFLRAHLIGSLTRALDDMHLLAALSQRRNRAEQFMSRYVGRRMSCLGCHNSDTSVTDSPDPALDRTWQPKGSFERALFGRSAGLADVEEMAGFFRRKGVLAGYTYTHDDLEERVRVEKDEGVLPFGWDPACGEFLPPDQIRPDDAVHLDGTPITATFIHDYGSNANIFALEGHLRAGFDQLRARGLVVADTGDVSAEAGLGWLVGASLANQLWSEAFGAPLTLSHGFPRNRWQLEILQALGDTFVAGGFSWLDLIVSVATHPYFNGRPSESAGYRPVFDPFEDEHLPVEDRRNTLGNTLHRSNARVLLHSAYTAMGWPAVPEYLIYYMEPSAQLQRTAGVFLKPGDPGFGGVSFQSLLGWESLFGACADLNTQVACPLSPILENPYAEVATVCELCNSRGAACDWDARCCDVAWDAYCGDFCDTGDPEVFDLATFPRLEPPGNGDLIRRLLDAAPVGATLGDAVSVLKDQLLARPGIGDAAERAVLEAVAGAPFDAPLTSALEPGLRLVCGALLASPQFLLAGDPGATPEELSEVPAFTLVGLSEAELRAELEATFSPP